MYLFIKGVFFVKKLQKVYLFIKGYFYLEIVKGEFIYKGCIFKKEF